MAEIMESVQGERSVFYVRLCKKADKWPTRRWRGVLQSAATAAMHRHPGCRQMAHPALIRAFLQPAATAVMNCNQEGCTHPPPFSASTEPIFKTDCATWWQAAKVRRRQKASRVVIGLCHDLSHQVCTHYYVVIAQGITLDQTNS